MQLNAFKKLFVGKFGRLSRASSLCVGPDAQCHTPVLCVGPQRSVCPATSLCVSGPEICVQGPALCVGPRRFVCRAPVGPWRFVSGPSPSALAPVLCVKHRRSLSSLSAKLGAGDKGSLSFAFLCSSFSGQYCDELLLKPYLKASGYRGILRLHRLRPVNVSPQSLKLQVPLDSPQFL